MSDGTILPKKMRNTIPFHCGEDCSWGSNWGTVGCVLFEDLNFQALEFWTTSVPMSWCWDMTYSTNGKMMMLIEETRNRWMAFVAQSGVWEIYEAVEFGEAWLVPFGFYYFHPRKSMLSFRQVHRTWHWKNWNKTEQVEHHIVIDLKDTFSLQNC